MLYIKGLKMGLLSGLADIGSDLWQGAKDVGDFAGLDGKIGYQGTWNTPNFNGLAKWNIPTTNIGLHGYVSNFNNTDNTGILNGLSHWLGSRTSEDWNNYSNIAKGLSDPIFGYLKYKNGKDMANMYKNQMAFNQAQIENAKKKQEQQSLAMQQGFNNSGLANI